MGVIPGYDYDLFISYAHNDNRVERGDDTGWVEYLRNELETSLKQKLGVREGSLSICFDRTSQALRTDDLLRKVERSALMVMVSSPSYVAPGEFTMREYQTFMALHNDPKRVFVVDWMPLDNDELYPFEVRRNIHWNFADRKGGRSKTYSPLDQREDFNNCTWDLVFVMLDQIREMTGHAAADRTAPGSKLSVLLAETAEDMDQDRRQIARYLRQFDVDVYPKTTYPRGYAGFVQAFTADVQKADHVVQLLGARPAPAAPGSRESYTEIQQTVARASGKPLIQWRRPELETRTLPSDGYRKLLESPSVLVFSIEDLKAQLRTLAEPKAATVRKDANSLVFINADRADLPIARTFQSAFQSLNLPASLPLFADGRGQATGDERADLEENLLECDIIVFVHESAPAEWIRRQLRHYAKVSAQRTTRPRAVAICTSSDQAKSAIAMQVPNARSLVIPNWNPNSMIDAARELAG